MTTYQESGLVGTILDRVLHPIDSITHPVSTAFTIADKAASTIIGYPVGQMVISRKPTPPPLPLQTVSLSQRQRMPTLKQQLARPHLRHVAPPKEKSGFVHDDVKLQRPQQQKQQPRQQQHHQRSHADRSAHHKAPQQHYGATLKMGGKIETRPGELSSTDVMELRMGENVPGAGAKGSTVTLPERKLTLEESETITRSIAVQQRTNSEKALREAETHAELLVEAEAMKRDSLLKLQYSREVEKQKALEVEVAREREYELERARAAAHEIAVALENERAQLEAEVELHKKKVDYAESLMIKHAESIQYNKALAEKFLLEYQEAELALSRLQFEKTHKEALMTKPSIPTQKELHVEVKARTIPEAKFQANDIAPITASATSVVEEHYKHEDINTETSSSIKFTTTATHSHKMGSVSNAQRSF